MFMNRLETDLKVWLKMAKSSLHCGNKVGASRLHALQMMIDARRGVNRWEDWKEAENNLLQTLSYICQFAKENGTANETNIFIHIMIDMMKRELDSLPKAARHRLQANPGINWDEAVGDVYPTEDSPDNLIPPADLDNIPL